ncbi:HrpE/YscL family type III secretion apparatus protein [Pseudomonas daroniae]|uniref:Type 3 secretion system stator protein n=1 Tax=Phytopseudomonas daroniae TaxID=2487519 RepID=A0A4Q9QU18_9GAMM|nr:MULTISPECIES: type III secretion system stator protein SctL [Pseudomonas]TBU78932.1 HrpE/YscL family type III secretion apparatus protein [Pseudomonas daroniae]TBU83156.1 HrpE/YscL family type III secretion apparatus protein [Pseudomonas sp. FRB 228]TBU83830.1 HrpE/YscL family type III secretion apparatus protein [Pseudomonas daroniae]TBU93007.1 HrpE/YscL family type III secretion apparatus protein [Pseudomonas daroniae]
MSTLPSKPGQRIVRAEQAAQWIDGYAFLQAAREEAERTQGELQQLRDQAREEGLAAGRAEGQREAAELLARTAVQVDDYLAGLEAQMTDLALGIVRRVIGELDDGTRLALCTRQALSAFREAQRLRLHVRPAQLEAVRGQLVDLGERLQVEADDSLAAGHARLSSPQASVELDLHTQLQGLRQALLPGVLEGGA